jgi:phosphatidylinositol alpha-mannosyltransferase
VVASRIPGHASVITHGEDGWLVSPQDPVALALGLVRMLADRDLRERIANAGRRTAQRYAWSAIARRVLAVYRGQADPAFDTGMTATLPAGVS